jgi:hypothetical protein
MAGSLAANLMDSVLRILKQVWGVVASLDRLKPSLPLRGRIRASLVWDFRGER